MQNIDIENKHAVTAFDSEPSSALYARNEEIFISLRRLRIGEKTQPGDYRRDIGADLFMVTGPCGTITEESPAHYRIQLSKVYLKKFGRGY